MAMIGYSASGYDALRSEINTRKNKLLDILNSFPEVQSAIADSWKGEDATAYSEELNKLIQSTIENINSTYDAMARQFEKTYNDWIEKQRTGA